MALDMLVLGIGIGLCMQVLTIIVQNTVDYRDLGVATSGVTFFRTLGSSFGAAVFGTVYSNVLRPTLPGRRRRVPASTRGDRDARPRCTRYPPAQIAPIVDAYAHAIHVVFLRRCRSPWLAFVLSLFLKEVPLRGTSRAAAADVGEGSGCPRAPTAAQRCRRPSRGWCAPAAPRRPWRSGRPRAPRWTSPTAGASARSTSASRVGADTSLQAISRRVRVPAQVLEPAFDAARDDGYLRRGGRPAAGDRARAEREIQKLVTATPDLAGGRARGLGSARTTSCSPRPWTDMARQFVDQDAERPAPVHQPRSPVPPDQPGRVRSGRQRASRTAAPTGRPTIIASSSAGANVSAVGRGRRPDGRDVRAGRAQRDDRRPARRRRIAKRADARNGLSPVGQGALGSAAGAREPASSGSWSMNCLAMSSRARVSSASSCAPQSASSAANQSYVAVTSFWIAPSPAPVTCRRSSSPRS